MFVNKFFEFLIKNKVISEASANVLKLKYGDVLKDLLAKISAESIEFKIKKRHIPGIVIGIRKDESIPSEVIARISVLFHSIVHPSCGDFLERVKPTNLKLSYRDSYAMKNLDTEIFVLEGTPTRGVIFVISPAETFPDYWGIVLDFGLRVSEVLIYKIKR